MEHQISRNPFINIPQRKLDDALEEILALKSDKNNVLTHEGALLTTVFCRYYNANIPVDYWYRDMHDFVGPKSLKKYYGEVTSDIQKAFRKGTSARLAGSHGVGKTTVAACILKRVLETNKYNALYVNLTDIITILLSGNVEDKKSGREILLNTDFLVIDELDARFMGSDNAADLFGRILEPVMRTRIQNRMPTFFCTNTAKVEESFSGPLQASIESLMNLVKLVPVIGGTDARESIRKGELV